MTNLDAPFPWFGGKSRAAPLIWSRLGDVPNYVEPFFGSGSLLLRRPHLPRIETVNDIDGFVCNAWRSIRGHPAETWGYADQPVNECDLHARHLWLRSKADDLTARLMGDPEYCDPEIAGWWLWGISCWIGGGWCGPGSNGPWATVDGKLVRGLSGAGQGVHRKMPCLSGAGQGVNRKMAGAEWMQSLAERMRNVRVCCGDWSRIMGPSPTTRNGITGVVLDPPYSAATGRDMRLYRRECGHVAAEVRGWCKENGDNPGLRIALCGYDTEHAEMESMGWTVESWVPNGGYGNTRKENENKRRERIWFSPHCLNREQLTFERGAVNGDA